MRRGSIILAAVGVAVLAAGPAVAAPAYPAPDGRCVDTTGVLGTALCARITAVLRADEDRTGDEIAVAVVPTTGDATIETWATGLFNAWGVGKRGQDNGVLLIVAIDDHQLRIATGRGLAGRLSDDQANQVITATITPEFRRGGYAAGILAGLDEIRRRLGHPVDPGAELVNLAGTGPSAIPSGVHGRQAAPPTGRDDAGGFPWWYLVVILVPVMAVVIVVNERSLRRLPRVTVGSSLHPPTAGPEGGGASGPSGSGGGFGGGGSDGGGASGSW